MCSYKFENSERNNNNIYQIKVSNYENLLLGLYFYSTTWDQIIDYRKFLPVFCDHMRYCQFLKKEAKSDGNDEMLFSLDESRFSTLNFLPENPSLPMQATVEYRIMNKASD